MSSSMRDVASRAGTSVSTVSHVVNGTRYVAPETAQRVRLAMKALGFSPPLRDRVSAEPGRRLLGLVVSDIVNPFFSEVAQGFELAALRHGWECTLADTDYSEVRLLDCVTGLLARDVAGVAIMTSEADARLARTLRKRHIPTVFLDDGPIDDSCSRIGIDYDTGIEEAVRHLYELGHRRVGFVSGPAAYGSVRQRRAAFERAAHLLRLEVVVEEAELNSTGGEHAVHQMMKAARRPTAVLACNDLMAIGVLQALDRMGLLVPQDVSVIGFDNIALLSVTRPALTTIEVVPRNIGIIAMEALRLMNGAASREAAQGREFRIRTRLVVKESTAATLRNFGTAAPTELG